MGSPQAGGNGLEDSEAMTVLLAIVGLVLVSYFVAWLSGDWP
jgi:hypothetical protein